MSIATPPYDPGPVPPDSAQVSPWRVIVPVTRASLERLAEGRDLWILNSGGNTAANAITGFLTEAAEHQATATQRLLDAVLEAGPYTGADMREDIRSALTCADSVALVELNAELQRTIGTALFVAAAVGNDAAEAVTTAVMTVLTEVPW